jgi:hypothetical protein
MMIVTEINLRRVSNISPSGRFKKTYVTPGLSLALNARDSRKWSAAHSENVGKGPAMRDSGHARWSFGRLLDWHSSVARVAATLEGRGR